MALTFTLNAGYTFTAGDHITIAKLNQLISLASGSVLSGTVDTNNIGDEQITDAKMALTQNWSGLTITLPSALDLSPAYQTGIANKATLGVPNYVGEHGWLSSGELYIANGTASNANWKLAGVLFEDSIAATPDHIGQRAMVAGITYFAVGVTDKDDWVPMRTDSVGFKNQAADPDALTNFVQMYARANDIYVLKPTGDPINITTPRTNIIIIKDDQKISGDSGGTPLALTWNQRDLESKYYDDDGIIGLAFNEITFPIGTWWVSGSCPGYKGAHKSRFKNKTGYNAGTLDGTSEASSTEYNGATRSFFEGKLIFTESGSYAVEHWVSSTTAWEQPASAGVPEIYTVVKLERL